MMAKEHKKEEGHIHKINHWPYIAIVAIVAVVAVVVLVMNFWNGSQKISKINEGELILSGETEELFEEENLAGQAGIGRGERIVYESCKEFSYQYGNSYARQAVDASNPFVSAPLTYKRNIDTEEKIEADECKSNTILIERFCRGAILMRAEFDCSSVGLKCVNERWRSGTDSWFMASGAICT